MTDEVTWARAYRPLRGRGLLLQLGVLGTVELLLYRSYNVHDARFHWATHFLVGLTAAALWQLLVLLIKAAPARGQLLLILGLHVVAMAPDLLFRGGVPHDQWMNLFLGHITVHYLPGGDTTWLVIALAMTAAYVVALWRWLRARHTEADAGLPPGIGIGGAAVLRPQADPRTHALGFNEYGPRGPVDVVLLHGLGASATFWRPVGELLAQHGLRVVVPDLLGFGSSIGIGTHFHLDDQTAAVLHLLDSQDSTGPVVLVGHSWGCAVAVELSRTTPERVRQLVLVSPPAFRNWAGVRDRFNERSWLARKTVDGSPLADLACGTMCLLRKPIGWLAPRLAPDVPKAVARDGVRHSWPAYRDALQSLMADNPLPAAIADPVRPTVVVLAADDPTVWPSDVRDLSHERVDVVELPGDHLLPLADPDPVATVVLSVSARTP